MVARGSRGSGITRPRTPGRIRSTPSTGRGPASAKARRSSAGGARSSASRRFGQPRLGLASGWRTSPRHLPEDPVPTPNRPRRVRGVVALQTPVVVDVSQALDHQPCLGVHAEHLTVERLGPPRIEHHEIAIAEGRRHRITHHSSAPQALRARPGCERRPGYRDRHLLRLIPYGLARPGRQPHLRGERDHHGSDPRLRHRRRFGSPQVVRRDRTRSHRRPHLRGDGIAAGRGNRPHQPLRVVLQG